MGRGALPSVPTKSSFEVPEMLSARGDCSVACTHLSFPQMELSARQGDEGHLPFSQVLDAYPDLPQHLLSCLSTNHLCPAAAEVYKVLVRQQCSEWQDGQRGTEVALAEHWARFWLPLLSQALCSPLPILQSNAANHLLTWTLRQLPAAQAPLAARFGGQDTMSLRAWVSLLKAQKSVAGALPLGDEALERLSRCLGSREEGVRLAALGLLCCSPNTNQPLSGTELQLLREFLPLNLNCDSSSFRQLLQAAVRKALVRLRDRSLALLRGKAPRRSGPGEGAQQLAQAVGEAATQHLHHSPGDSHVLGIPRCLLSARRLCGMAAAAQHRLTQPGLQLPEEEDGSTPPGRCFGDLHRHLEP